MKMSEHLHKAGIVNHRNEPPIFIVRYKHDKHTFAYLFYANSTDLKIWNDNREKIEIDNFFVKDIIRKGNNKILLFLATQDLNNPLPIFWDNKYLRKSNDLELVLGKDYALGSLDIWNASNFCHALIGGQTNSGKTVMIRNLIFQLILQNSDVYLADFKQLVDYPKCFLEKITTITDRTNLLEILKKLDNIYEERIKRLIQSGFSNIETYNKNATEKINHIAIIFDEVAEIFTLDKKLLTKEEQIELSEIFKYIDKTARLGRACGFHLILSTQRPSADVIPPQTRTNVSFRVCFRADDILSNIVLDNKDASQKIPKGARGLYLSNINGNLSQAFWVEDYSKFL